MPEVRWGDADHCVHHRPRRRGCDPATPREGRGAVSSRPTECGSSLRRFLSLASANAACAGCALGGGSGVRDRSSRLLCRANLPRPPVPANSGGRSTRRHSPWSPRTGLNAVLAGVERKELPIPDELAWLPSCTYCQIHVLCFHLGQGEFFG